MPEANVLIFCKIFDTDNVDSLAFCLTGEIKEPFQHLLWVAVNCWSQFLNFFNRAYSVFNLSTSDYLHSKIYIAVNIHVV